MFFKQLVLVCLATCFNSSTEIEGTEENVRIEAKEKLYLACEDVNLTCKVQSMIENPSISWFVNGSNVTIPNEKFIVEYKDCKPSTCAILKIKCAKPNDSGNYSCRLETEDLTINSTNYFKLHVHEPVNIVEYSKDLRLRANQSGVVNLMCTFKGKHLNSFYWSKKDSQEAISTSLYRQEILDDDRISTFLTLKGITRETNGTYMCSASDNVMSSSQDISLIVLSVPTLEIDTTTSTDNQTVFMNWTLHDGNSPMKQYHLQYMKNGAPGWQFHNEMIPGGNNWCIIKKLEPNTTYTFKIQAQNEIGNSDWYESRTVKTLSFNPHFIPDVHIKGAGPNSINIAWSYPPVEVKDHVHYFKVLLQMNNNMTKETVVHRDFSYAFTTLQSATTYYFQVAACNEYTNECGNWSKVVSEKTLDGLASAPENVTIDCYYDNVTNTGVVTLYWKPPKNPNGDITQYITTILGNASFVNEFGELNNSIYGPKSNRLGNETYSTTFKSLPPNTNYTLSVAAVTRSRDAGESAQRYCVMPPTVPDRENLLKFDWDRVEDKGNYVFKLLKPKLSERNGAICCFTIFVVKLLPHQSLQELPVPEDIPVFSYDYVHHEAGNGTYIADIFDKEFINREILVGDEHITNGSKCSKCPLKIKKGVPVITTATSILTELAVNNNVQSEEPFSSAKLVADSSLLADREDKNILPYDGPLDVDSNYTGFIKLIVFGKDNFIPAYSSYFKILKPGPQPTSLQVNEFSAIAFQILCGLIAISIMIIAAFCLLQRYTKQVAEAQGVEMTLRNSFRHLCRSLRGSHVPVSSNPPDVLPISKTALLTTFTELAKDSDYGFEQEFEMLPDRFTDRTTKASEARENTSKNRYPDIKAYDQTRVKLSQIDGILGSDYINANFVMSYKERKKFICAQGPMENTVCDFWRMIWEQHLELVLMLTNLEEYSKTKCAKYWPDKEEEKKLYNDITIFYISEKRYSDYVVRELKMVRNTGQNREPEERIIYQYHFLMWKDFQAPEHPSGLLKFIWRVNEAYSLEKGPILVHCSAGVGRTGTLVAIDSLLQQLDNEGQVLIFNTICDLRHQRNFLVQSLKQYIFVYRALVEYAYFGNTEIRANNLKSTVEKMKRIENGKPKTRIEEEYEKLSFTISSHEHKTLAVGSAPENAVKNRSGSIIPYDKNRVILTPIPGREHSTFINASFIEGYDNSESFIITQDPILDVTVVDFWRMISELSISTIVMLSSSTTSDGQKKAVRYWPDEEISHGNVNVKHIQSESCPYYTRREFYVKNVKMDENLVVTQYQYNGWPTVEGEVPEVTRGLIELMDHATQHSDSIGTGPMLVHCECGSDRSSMFVALCILAQQLKTERRVDVVTTARKLRSQRQGMLTSFAQYEFLYRAILNYVDLHHLFETETN